MHALVRSPGRAQQLPADVAIHDITGDLATVLERAQVGALVHLAARTARLGEDVAVDELVASNVTLTGRLLDAMERAGVRRLVNAGSFWQTSGGAHFAPNSLYAATKQAAECLIEYHSLMRQLRAVTLRLPHVYGPGDARPKLLPRLARLGPADPPVALSPGEQEVDFVHVDDVARAFEVALERVSDPAPVGGVHEVFSVTSGEVRTLRDVVAELERARGSTIPVHWGGLPYPVGEVLTVRPAHPLPAWSPRVSLADGMRELVHDASAAAAHPPT